MDKGERVTVLHYVIKPFMPIDEERIMQGLQTSMAAYNRDFPKYRIIRGGFTKDEVLGALGKVKDDDLTVTAFDLNDPGLPWSPPYEWYDSEEPKHVMIPIKIKSAHLNRKDDPSYPYKLEAAFFPPKHMTLAFRTAIGEREELIFRSMNLEVLDELIARNGYRDHPSLEKLTVTGPEGVIEEITGRQE